MKRSTAALRTWTIGLALATVLLAPTSILAAPPMWKVTNGAASVYLFGTMHALQSTAKWRTPAFDTAFAKAGIVWFEVDTASLNDQPAAVKLIQAYGMDPAHPLSTKLDPEHVAKLNKVLAAHKLSPDAVNVMRPWLVGLLVSAFPFMEGGFDPKAGADVVLGAQAASDHKTQRSFETAEQQIRYLADLPPEVELAFLKDTLDEASSSEAAEALKMQAAWISGDLNRLGPLEIGKMKRKYPQLYEVLVRRRNQDFADALAKELTGSDVEMVSVGALHMVGDVGLPALLKAKGFKVERVQ